MKSLEGDRQTWLSPELASQPSLGLPLGHPAFSTSESPAAEYWKILARRRWTVCGILAVFLIAAAVVSFKMTPTYQAEARVSLGKEGGDSLGLKDDLGSSPVDEADYNMQLDAQVQILSSDTLILQTLKQMNLVDLQQAPSQGASPLQGSTRDEERAVRDYKARLKVARIPHTPIIELRFSSPNPQIAADFLNNLVKVFIQQNFETRYESAKLVSTWLSRQLEDLKAHIQNAQAQLVNFEKEKGIIGVNDKQDIVTQKLDDLNKELTVAQADRMQKEALYRATEASDPELIPGVAESPSIRVLKDQQAALANSYAQATAEMGSAHPKVIQLKSELEQVESALRKEYQKIMERNRSSFVVAQRREEMLRQALDQQTRTANQLNEKATGYQILKHDVESSQELYDGLSKKLREAGLSASLRSGNVRIVDQARVPSSPSSPNLLLNLALAIVAGLVGGGTLVLVQERFDKRLRSPEQVESFTSLPLVGIVPLLEDSYLSDPKQLTPELENTKAIVTHPESRMQLVESYRALRTSILMEGSSPPQVIMVTSSLGSEGKTTTSINCAMVMADKGNRVLLVDADLRAPRIHKVLGLDPSCGLSTILEERTGVKDLDAIVQYSKVPNLFVLPAGPVLSDPSQLLDSGTMKKKIAEWRRVFTHIVIDTPPLLLSSDSLVLSAEADFVVLTIRANVTPKQAVFRARHMLMSVKAKLAGVVLNGVDLSSTEFGSYGYYSYGKYPQDQRAV
jgi:capsular exopolysaccharide synthesis family protein